jgi:ABC-type sugar transport system ATPase subunit
MAIVFVSHRLAEVFEIADRITILRDGRLVGTYDRSAIDPDRAIRLMVGRPLSTLYPPRASEVGPLLLEVRGLQTGRVGPVDLEVRAGEIVGLAGLRGSGRSQVARALFGAAGVQAGEIRLLGKPVRWPGPRRAVKAGIAFVPSDRKEEGIFPRMSVADNLVPVALGKVSRAGFVVAPELRRLASRLVQDFRIRTSGLDQVMSRLSGGNQQKALLAKWLAVQPRFLIVDEPTQGIDVGAKAEIHALLRELAHSGVGILMVSSDLPEVLGMCDCIVVMAGGRVRAVLAGKDATEEQVMEFAAGRGAIA